MTRRGEGHRLFVALRPGAAVRDALTATMADIPAARWQDDDQLHCTICFIGEVDRHTADDVAEALARLRYPAIDAISTEFGTFSNRGKITSLWVGLSPISALATLHAKVRQVVNGVGVAIEARAYRPHITRARFSRGCAPSTGILAGLPAPPRLPMRFMEFVLFESMLTRDGAVYEPVAAFPLADQIPL